MNFMNKNYFCSLVHPQNEKTMQEIINLRYKILRQPLGLSFTNDELDSEAKRNYYVTIQENNSQALIGTLLLQIMDDPTILKMRQVAIRSDLQRMGFGKILIQFSEEWAKSKCIKRIILHSRKSAFQFYISLGYSFKDDSFMEVGMEHYFMWKDL